MMQVGIFTGYFPYGARRDGEEDPRARLQHGAARPALQGCRLLDAGQITKEKAKQVRETFRDHNLPVCCLSGYTNIVHPDQAEREQRLGHLKEIIRNARHFGSPYVISETGTYNTEIGLGAPSEEQDRGRLRRLPRGDPRAGADRL